MTKSAASLEPLHDRSRLTAADAITLLEGADLSAMMEVAATLRDQVTHPSFRSRRKSSSRSPSFAGLLPLLHVCSSAGAGARAYLSANEVLEIAAAGTGLAVTRRCSRLATSPSDGIENTGGIGRTGPRNDCVLSRERWRPLCCRKPGCCRTSMPV
jgi:hypothetical protein